MLLTWSVAYKTNELGDFASLPGSLSPHRDQALSVTIVAMVVTEASSGGYIVIEDFNKNIASTEWSI